jgi:YegS/Rv2252/BmrU family lipid kinase
MQLGKTLLIVNPAAKHGETAKLLPAVERLTGGVSDREIVTSAGPRHAYDLARQASGFDTIVAVGGDGTVHEAVNGIMDHPEGARPKFAVVPTGSGNDYARTLGMSTDLSTALRQIVGGRTVTADLGKCNGVWFAESVSVGLDARVTAKAVQLKVTTGLSGLALYLRALIFVLSSQYYPHRVVIQYDDETPFETDLLTMAGTNGPTYGGGFKITPDSVLDDGLLDICRIDMMPKPEAFARLPFVIIGKHTGMRRVHMAQAKRVTIVAETPFEGQVDGEVMLDSSYDIQVVPEALTVIVPSGTGEQK